MGSHQPVAVFPINAPGDRRAQSRQIAVAAVDDFALDPAHPGNGIFHAGGIGQYADIAGLPAAANIKGGTIQFHAAVDHRRNGSGKLPQVGIGMKEQFGHRKSPRPLSVSNPSVIRPEPGGYYSIEKPPAGLGDTISRLPGEGRNWLWAY